MLEALIAVLVSGLVGFMLYALTGIQGGVKENTRAFFDMRENILSKIADIHELVSLVERHVAVINGTVKATSEGLAEHIKTDETFHAEITQRLERIEAQALHDP